MDGKCPIDEVLCKRLVKAIETAKILDPACGSGAFPMGALLKMVELLRILKKLPEDANLYDLKLKLIENCKHCNSCHEKCPYGLDTPTLLEKNYEDFKQFWAKKQAGEL